MAECARLDAAQQSTAASDMEPEAFRRSGYRVVDQITQDQTNGGTYPVLARMVPGTLHRSLSSNPLTHPESMEAILAAVDRRRLPGLTQWTSPDFQVYFSVTNVGPGMLGELLCAGPNVNARLWRTSPVAMEWEQMALDRMRHMLRLPYPLFDLINEMAARGTLNAHTAPREALSDLPIRKREIWGRSDVPPLPYDASQQAHASVERAGIVSGLGESRLRKIGMDCAFRLDVAQRERAIEEDSATGWRPIAVVATDGTTSTASVEPVPQIADLCTHDGLWLLVDAAYASGAAASEMLWVLAGCELVDSLTVKPDMCLIVPCEGSVFFRRRPEVAKAACSVIPEYLCGIDSEAQTRFDGQRYRDRYHQARQSHPQLDRHRLTFDGSER
jgi:aromatic-L-amino-acid/L-tryptophan decarboxylase